MAPLLPLGVWRAGGLALVGLAISLAGSPVHGAPGRPAPGLGAARPARTSRALRARPAPGPRVGPKRAAPTRRGRDSGGPREPELRTVARALYSGAADHELERLRGQLMEIYGPLLTDYDRRPPSVGPRGERRPADRPLPTRALRYPDESLLSRLAVHFTGRFRSPRGPRDMAQAVADLLLRTTDAEGHVDTEAAATAYGALGRDLARRLLAIGARAAPPPGAFDRSLAQYANVELIDRLAVLGGVSAPPMATFDRLVRARARTRPLAGLRVIGIQHLLGSTGGLLRALEASGVERSEMDIVGKAYSQSFQVERELRHDGFSVVRAGMLRDRGPHDPVRDHSEVAERDLLHLLENEARWDDGRKRFLVLDDGGRMIRLIHERYPQLWDRVVAIEQTTRGIRELEGLDLKFPVIDVAQSWAKRTYEAPLIGRSVGGAVVRKLAALRAQGRRPGRTITVLGYGAVGRATARDLRARGYAVEAYDPRPEALAAAPSDGVRALGSLDEALGRARVVVSATGTTTIGFDEVERLRDGAVLINAASGDTELHPGLRAAYQAETLGPPGDPVREDVVLHLAPGREVVLANAGAVINFDGDPDPIPPRFIQLTRGLLYLGALQAARTRAPGLHPLERRGQRRLVDGIEAELAAHGESLSAPSY